MLAKKLPNIDREEQEKEYFAVFNIFERFLEATLSEDLDEWEVLEELMSLRAEFSINHAIRGFGMDWEKALELVRGYEGELSDADKERRTILVAAIDNLVDFAVMAEYQMVLELSELDFDFDDEDFDEPDEDEYDEDEIEAMIEVFYRYNFKYANVENLDIQYAMIVAGGLAGLLPATELIFMTQGDERVRPWHLQYEGFSAPKMLFPRWLVPPIEHQCRCYLEEFDITGQIKNISAKSKYEIEMPQWFNPTFKESVAFGGRIFSGEHPYFQCEEKHKRKLQKITGRIKSKYLQQ